MTTKSTQKLNLLIPQQPDDHRMTTNSSPSTQPSCQSTIE
jgi:hypothetical protein